MSTAPARSGLEARADPAEKEEGFKSYWRGNGTNVLRYFPTQALNFAFKDYFKLMFGSKREAGYARFLLGNIASGAAAGAAGSEWALCDAKASAYARQKVSLSIRSTTPERGYPSTRKTQPRAAPGSSMVFLMSSEIPLHHHQRPRARLTAISRKTIATDGVFGLYRGYSASVVGIIVYRG